MSFFDSAYLGVPPWDIGKEQTAFRELTQSFKAENSIKGPVLDVGCGTGENSLFFASLGYNVTGIDSSYLAISKALEKADARNLHNKTTFLTMDLFDLSELTQKFNTVIDSGVFHMFSEQSRINYQKSINQVLNKGGYLYLLAFSYLEPLGIGPSQRLTKSDYITTFQHDWKIVEFRDVPFETNFSEMQPKGLLTIIEKL